ncbi:DedA family protein [Tabrizicola sp. J26]|uniref:DedA family protein n=1 Tax=Alitabrizicola rongguiensis TaxID=2909234 RepID=UPI001F3AE5B4|nr:DedA family protein [Tabrizicola rongguiensis]MCF1710079.1 DedA family protein [Tabrizicola rongguiensis]
MIDSLYGLVPTHGPGVLFLATFLSCLALPIPSSLLMMAAGAFVASGDLAALSVLSAALAGALIGDQTGYGAGRLGGAMLWRRLANSPTSGPMLRKAADALDRRATATVYFSRWLVSALGPYVNFAAGATQVNWRRFSLASLLGESTWVLLYVGLGYVFAAQLDQMGETVIPAIGFLGAGMVTLLLGRAIWQWWRSRTSSL